MSPDIRRSRTRSDELVSLAERMGYLQALRMGFAVVVMGAALFASGVIGASLSDLALVTAGYLSVSAAVEGVRRLGKGRRLQAVGAMLLIDGAYLAWVMYSTGGTLSPLRFLFYVQLVAVTLLASYKTGLKMAAWDSLLFFTVFYAQAAGLLEAKEGIADALPGQGALFTQISLFNVSALWLVAAAAALFSNINERELRRRKGDVEALAEMAARLEDAIEPAAVADVLLEKLGEAFGFKRGIVLGRIESEVSLLAYMGPGEAAQAPAGVDPVVQRAWDDHESQLVKKLDADEDKRLAALLPFARNVVVIPLFAERTPVGALAVEYAGRGGRIERRVVSMVAQFAAHAALALKNAWLLQQVQKMAETDALTGVANRREFENTLARELSRAARTGEPLTLAMLDVDHFKKFNDTYGHQAGDAVLKDVAQALVDNSRDFDVVARYGGEEFAVILPGCSMREALLVAERLREGVAAVTADAPIRASAGVASFPTHAADAVSLVKAADEALYESKRAGRDRVTRSRRRARQVHAGARPHA